jgi:hypothetical protein
VGASDRILFFVDEHLPNRLMHAILAPHVVSSVQISARDQEILRTAELQSAIIVTSDTWFLRELYRVPFGHKHCLTKAGVIQLPGDQRVGIDFSQTQIRIYDPSFA